MGQQLSRLLSARSLSPGPTCRSRILDNHAASQVVRYQNFDQPQSCYLLIALQAAPKKSQVFFLHRSISTCDVAFCETHGGTLFLKKRATRTSKGKCGFCRWHCSCRVRRVHSVPRHDATWDHRSDFSEKRENVPENYDDYEYYWCHRYLCRLKLKQSETRWLNCQPAARFQGRESLSLGFPRKTDKLPSFFEPIDNIRDDEKLDKNHKIICVEWRKFGLIRNEDGDLAGLV